MIDPFALSRQPHSNPTSAPAGKRSPGELPGTAILCRLSLLAGLAAILAGCSSGGVSEAESIPTISPESVTAEEVEKYATAILAIEQKRELAYSDIQQLTNNQQVPDVTCTERNKVNSLDSNIREIAVNYCNQAKEIGEGQGLTIEKFNAITATAQSDSELQKRIQNELVRLQSSS